VYRELQFVRICRHNTSYGKTTSAERNSGRKLTLTEREKEYFEKSQNCCNTSDRTAELNIHPEDPVSTKTVYVSFTNPTSSVGLQLLNL
jgi:hypothetical protein